MYDFSPTEKYKIMHIESEVDFVKILDEDENLVETEKLMKKATILFNNGSKIHLRCYTEDCEDELDAFCISDCCEYCEIYDDNNKRINVNRFRSKLLPQFIKRVWRSRKRRKLDE